MAALMTLFVQLAARCAAVWRDGRGATAVEFAIVALPLFMLIVGTIEFGRAYWVRNQLQFAVEEAARYALAHIDATTSQVASIASGKLAGYGFNSEALTVQATSSTVSGVNFMNISAQYQLTFMSPLIPLPSVTLSSKANVPLML